MALVRPVGSHAHAPECVPLTPYLARLYILGPEESKPKTSVASHSEWHPGFYCHSAGSLDYNTTLYISCQYGSRKVGTYLLKSTQLFAGKLASLKMVSGKVSISFEVAAIVGDSAVHTFDIDEVIGDRW